MLMTLPFEGPSRITLDDGDSGGPPPCPEARLSDTCEAGGKTVLSPTNSFIEEISCLGDDQEELSNVENEAEEQVEEDLKQDEEASRCCFIRTSSWRRTMRRRRGAVQADEMTPGSCPVSGVLEELLEGVVAGPRVAVEQASREVVQQALSSSHLLLPLELGPSPAHQSTPYRPRTPALAEISAGLGDESYDPNATILDPPFSPFPPPSSSTPLLHQLASSTAQGRALQNALPRVAILQDSMSLEILMTKDLPGLSSDKKLCEEETTSEVERENRSGVTPRMLQLPPSCQEAWPTWCYDRPELVPARSLLARRPEELEEGARDSPGKLFSLVTPAPYRASPAAPVEAAGPDLLAFGRLQGEDSFTGRSALGSRL